MTTTIKITELTNIGANLASSTVIPVVNMGGTPTTEKAVLGNVANFILAGAGGNYVAAAVATTAITANTVLTNAQPNITSVGSLTGLTVSNVTGVVNFSNTANVTLGNVSNLHIAGGTIGQILSTDGAGNLSWASDTTTYGNSNVVSLLSAFGSNTISTTGNISVGNITATNLGNVSTINRDGNSSNVLYGNGVFAPVAGGANTGNVTFDNQAVVGTGDQYGGSGLYLAPGIESVGNLQYLRVRGGDYPTHIHLDTGDNQYFDQYFGDDSKYLKLANTGNIVIRTDDLLGNGAQWTFGFDGAVTFPTLNVDIHNGGVQSAQTLQFGDPTQQAIITGPTPPTGQSAQRIIIQGQNGGTGEGGDVYLWAGDAQINGGDIKIYAGDADNVSAGSGGYINLAGGAGFDNGGDITLNGGSSANGYGGQISITGGTGQIDGGPASISGGYSATGTGGAVNITGGTSSVGPSAYGNVEIGSGIYGWTFDNTGNFKLPGSILGAGNLKLSPDSTNAASYLDIFLTSGPDLHLVASNGANLILGEDNGPNVMTSWNGNAYIQSWNQNTGNVGGIWTFNGDGNLTLPANTFAVNYANGTQVSIGGAAGNAGDIQINVAGNIGADSTLRYVDNGGEMTLYADYLNAPGIFTSDIYAGDGTPSNITLTTSYGNATWTFDTTGNLSVPGGIVGPSGANFTIYSNAAAHEFIFADDGTFYAPDDAVLGGNAIYIGPGANTLSGIEHEVLLASSNHFAYVQGVVNNISDNGSAEWVALGAKGGDIGGWGEIGFTSSGFGDANYTITGAGDGYVFAQSYAPGQTLLGGGGNLVLSTGNNGTTKDIIFGTGGFLTSNIFGRISHANNSLELSRTGATITFPDATEQNTAWTGSVATVANGNSNVNIATSNGNIVITSAGTNSWNFDSTGNLTIPGSSGGFIKTVSNASIGVAAVDNGTNNPAQLLSMTNAGAATSIISAYATNATIQTNATGTLNTWQFDNAGNLTLPTSGHIIVSGGLVSSGASPAPTINGFSITNSVGISGNGNIAGNNISATGNISGNTNGFTIGYLNIPQVAAANATLALTDAGKHYYSTTAGNFTLTVPLNSSVAFATGTAVSIVVQAAGNILVNAASGVTLYMAGNSTAANRVVGGYGMATLMKVGTDTWFINGTGVS